MSESFEDILDICIDRIAQGDSIEDCLNSYPKQADYLEPILRTALTTQESYSTVKPRPEFERLARHRFQSALNEKTKGSEAKHPALQIWRRGWVMVAMVVLVLLTAGGGTVAASSSSLPGDTLYPVKTTAEKVQGFFTFGREAKANFHIKLGERRLSEMERLEEKSRVVPSSLLNVMNTETERAIKILEKSGEIKKEVVSKLVDLTSNQKTVMERIRANAPITAESQGVRVKFQEAIERSQSSHNSAISLREMIPGLQKNDTGTEGNGKTPQSRYRAPLKLIPDMSLSVNNEANDVVGESRAWGTTSE